ncbi:hypothetical protein MXL81_06810 [Staphylococcus pseudoxylosus]|uniref:hypothetical protein n=1 Tax=Staphylococcus pseudoxylosus TaxID=2282419 RepID=UPI002DBCABAD|nr:hypothetical protein [Staphylococcus pseudoxylosus]MEB6170382.1 hypothetical protein [Staphylococcus pseudoxylosus]
MSVNIVISDKIIDSVIHIPEFFFLLIIGFDILNLILNRIEVNKSMMDGHNLKQEINQGIRNKYDVFVDTMDGLNYNVDKALNSSDSTVTVQLSKGIVVINADKVVAIRKMETSSNN